MKTFKLDGHSNSLAEGETPFQDSPSEIKRRSIEMTRVPTTIDALLSLVGVIGNDEFDESAQAALNAYLGEEVTSVWDMPISQFGGEPLIYQGHKNMVCPNPKCPASTLEHPYGEMTEKYLMKEMALIHWKDEPTLERECFQLHYTVCAICFSIRAEYRCS